MQVRIDIKRDTENSKPDAELVMTDIGERIRFGFSDGGREVEVDKVDVLRALNVLAVD